jgi:hypothetical protein
MGSGGSPFLFISLFHFGPRAAGYGRIVAIFQLCVARHLACNPIQPPEVSVVKQPVIRQVKSLYLSCDPVGNLLLAKFSYHGAKDSCVFIPASIVFWLLQHLPVNQDPNLRAPEPLPKVYQEDWDDNYTPRVFTVQCKQFADAIRMHFELDRKPDLMVLLDRANVELLRQMLEAYRPNLMDLGV